MKKKLFTFSLFCSALMISASLQSCGSLTKAMSQRHTIAMTPVAKINHFAYDKLDYGVNIQVVDNRGFDELYTTSMGKASIVAVPSRPVEQYISESIGKSMNAMGFDVYSKSPHNYNLIVTINDLIRATSTSVKPNININIDLRDRNMKSVYSTTISSTGKNILSINKVSPSLNSALQMSLEQIDWDKIASFLKISDRAADEKNKQVTGSGDTALESTVIRWFVASSPAGADVQWRVVSSTPDVKNTNQNFLGSTPYESTESFDIMGLIYNNSGNVQIEVSCEKAGYVTQRKRFNVRQAIDQKEISTKFNLVKEE